MGPISRRDFLKLSAVGTGGLAFSPFQPNRNEPPNGNMGRVAVPAISIYKEPHMDSQIVGQRFRDEIVHIYDEVTPPSGPVYNPLWYRVWGGYAHSAHIQRVKIKFNKNLRNLREAGQLLEVSVPYIQSWQFSKAFEWQPSTRLYYESVHWATSIEAGPDGEPWYRLTSELWTIDYYVPSTHLRPIKDEELTPISPEIDPEEKRILVNLDEQTLTAFEKDRTVFHTTISSGLRNTVPGRNGVPTETPHGSFNISEKLPSKHMGQGRLTDDLEDYILLGVPWTSFFHPTGVAFHGTYWHNNFGRPMSHGCINMRNADAKWLFQWTTPVSDHAAWRSRARGTKVEVI